MWWNKYLILQCSVICVMQMIAAVDSQEFITPEELFARLKNDGSNHSENVGSDSFVPLGSTTTAPRNPSTIDRSTTISGNSEGADNKIIAKSEVFEEKSVARAKNNTGDGTDTGFKTGATVERKSNRNFYHEEFNSQDPNNGRDDEFRNFQNQGYGERSLSRPLRPPGFHFEPNNRNYPAAPDDLNSFGIHPRHPMPNSDPFFNHQRILNNHQNFNPPTLPSWVRDQLSRNFVNQPSLIEGGSSGQTWTQESSGSNFKVPFEANFNTNINSLRRPGWTPLTVNRNPLDHFPTGFRTENNFFDNNFRDEGPLNGLGSIRNHNSGYRTTSFTDGNGQIVERTVTW